MKKAIKSKDKFNKFDEAEKKIKDLENSVYDIANEFSNEDKQKDLLIHAEKDLEKAESEIEEADEDCF